MRQLLILPAILLLVCRGAAGQFDSFFTSRTMRVDYYHTGTKGKETIALDEVYEEGEWPGSRVNLLDTLNLGEYLLRVFDRASGLMIYSRGFSSMFQEWQTTDEAASGAYRTFSETVRFPFPKRAVQVAIARRDRQMIFHELATLVLDPADPGTVNKQKPAIVWPFSALIKSGDPAKKVDIVILGDGYTREEMGKFRSDARHFTDVLFSTSPFDRRRDEFNIWTIEVPSAESGIDIPDKDVWKAGVLGTRYDTFGSARYVLTTENRTLRDIAALVPYDFVCILVNDTRYGGGGIFQLYSTTYTKEMVKGQEWQMDYVFVHEFGHSFAGLGDEYYTSTTAYNDFYPPGVEPWEPNVTALLDPGNLKWKDLATPGIAIPTAWAKVAYDSIEAIRGKLDRLAPDYYEKREPLYRAEMEILHRPEFRGKVGAFEGAGYAAKGLYRPSLDCRMFSLSTVGFDPVCSAAINRMVDFYSH